jgi:uncharacterized repeat protein (TIGR01451 family)
MKLLRVFLPAVAAFLLLVVLFAWVTQTALANVSQPADFRAFDAGQPAPPQMPQSSDVISKFLPAGDNYIHGLIYYNGSLYASTRTAPDEARVLRIDPDTLEVTTSITLTSLENGEDIVAAQNYIWVILFTQPAVLVRVNPATLEWNIAVKFNETLAKTMEAGETLKYAFGYLWAGGRERLAQIDISDPLNPTYSLYDFSFLNLSTSSGGLFGSLAFDNQFLWATYKQYTGTMGLVNYASSILKMDPTDPTGIYTKTDIPVGTPDDNVYTGGAYFVGSEESPNQTTPSDIYKFSPDPTVYTATQAASSASYGLFANPDEPQFVWGAYVGSPGIVKKFDLNASPLLTVTLPSGFNDPSEIAFDPSGNVYITSWQAPAGIVKLTPQYLTADLRIGANGRPDPVYAGSDITYTVSITNDGSIEASGVRFTDTLPAQVSFLSSTPGSPDCTIQAGNLSCSLGSLGAHSSKQVILSAHVNGMLSDTITNTAVVTSTLPDPNQQNNIVLVKTVVNPPEADVLIGASSSPNSVIAGQEITYTLSITNNGPSTAAGITVMDTLPAQLSFVSSRPAAPNCTHSGGQVICNLGQLSAHSSQKVTIVARVGDFANGPIINTVGVGSTTSDPDLLNNTSILQTSLTSLADLSVQLSANKSEVAFGDILQYTIHLGNFGPSGAISVTLQDNLPAGVDFVSSSPGTIPCSSQTATVTCKVGNLAPANDIQLELLVKVNQEARTGLHDSVSVSATTPDPITVNNSASLDTRVFYRLYLPVTR